MSNSNDPMNFFGQMDFSKMMQDFKVPGVDMESLMETQRKNVEALNQANRVAVEGMQALAQRQSEIMRQTMDEMRAAMEDLSKSANAQEMSTKQAELVKEAMEKALANMRELAEMVSKSNTEAFEVVNQRVNESFEELKGLVEQGKK